jgi:hypothetical protein
VDNGNVVICDLGGLISLAKFSDGVTLIDKTHKTEIEDSDSGG